MFSKLNSGCEGNPSATDYENSNNCVIFKPIPVTDFDTETMKNIFDVSGFSTFSASAFSGSGSLGYTQCLIDLNPTLSDYNKEDPYIADGISTNVQED